MNRDDAREAGLVRMTAWDAPGIRLAGADGSVQRWDSYLQREQARMESIGRRAEIVEDESRVNAHLGFKRPNTGRIALYTDPQEPHTDVSPGCHCGHRHATFNGSGV